MTDLAARIAGFPAVLRSAGLGVGLDGATMYLKALAGLAEIGTDELFWAGRILLVSQPENLAVHDRLFREWFLGEGGGRAAVAREPDRQQLAEGTNANAVAADRRRASARSASAYASPIEVIRQRNSLLWPRDRASQDQALVDSFRRHAPWLRTRRRIHVRAGAELDLRSTLRCSLRSGGEITTIARATRCRRKRPIVLLIDVSRSMHDYSDDFMRAAALLVRADPGVEVFALGTRLTRVTGSLGRGTLGTALAATSRSVVDWDGGTRLGETVALLLADKRNSARLVGATIVLMSDGLERGDPAQLIAGITRLSRLSRRLILATPLAVDPRYRAATRAMLGMLPLLDLMVGCASLQDITTLLGRLTTVDRAARGDARDHGQRTAS